MKYLHLIKFPTFLILYLYIHIQKLSDREKSLKPYNFTCACIACVNYWPTHGEIPKRFAIEKYDILLNRLNGYQVNNDFLYILICDISIILQIIFIYILMHLL